MKEMKAEEGEEVLSNEDAFLMSRDDALAPTTSALCRESHPNFLHQ